MITVIAHNRFRPESLDTVVPLYKKLVEQTRREEGCIRYDAVQSTSNPGQLTMIEVWESHEALQQHGTNPDFLNLVGQLKTYSETPSEIAIFKELI